MTDRVKGFTVTLAKDIRIDDVQPLMDAIAMLKGVIHVEPSTATVEDDMNRMRVKHELREKFYNFIQKELSF